jgi:hypothetical protein
VVVVGFSGVGIAGGLGFLDSIAAVSIYPLLDQNCLDRAHPQLHLGKIGALIMIVIMCSHRRNTTNYRVSGQIYVNGQ